MKAWQFTTTNEPLVLAEIPEPTPGPGEVVLDIKVAGLCHSDVGAMTEESWLPLIPNRPIVIGHEIAGVISAVGLSVTEWVVGDKVGVWVGPGDAALSPGYGRDGGFTFKHRVAAEYLVRMPEGLTFALAALGTDAGATAYHATMIQGAVAAGDKVGIIGLGGLGQVGARVAVVAGAEVHVAEVNEAVWPLATELGCASVVGDVAEWAGKDFDVIIDFAGYGTTTAGALKAVGRNGKVVLVGMARAESTINTFDLILQQRILLGSVANTKDDLVAIYALLSSGQVKPVVTVIEFDDIPQGLDDLRHHRVTGRVVAHVAD